MRLNTLCRNIYFTAVVSALLLFVAAGCATDGRPVDRDAPDWVVQRPTGDAEYEYFVGFGLDEAGVQSRAEEAATYGMISEITRYIGVEVTTETTATARSTLDNFEAQLEEQVQQRGEAVVTGFQIVDSYVRTQDGETMVYLLGRYDRAQLQAEQQRFRELFQERIDAIDIPEQRGRSLYESGRHGAALPYLLQAAAAAAVSDVDNADIRFDRNMVLARQIIDNLIIEVERERISAVIHQSLDEPIVVTAHYQADGERFPVADLPIQVGYREMLNGRRLAIRTAQIRTDSDGRGVFQHPAPTFVGSERITLSLDLASSMEPLHRLGGRYRSLVRSLEDSVIRARTSLQIDVESRAGNIPTAVLILDTDIAGNPINGQATADGLREVLNEAGFVIRSIGLRADILTDLSDDEILQAVRAGYGDKIERLIFGKVRIQEFNESDGFIVNVSGTIRAIDIHTGEMLHTTTTSSRTRGTSSRRVISSAFRNLGSSVGQDMLRSLP